MITLTLTLTQTQTPTRTLSLTPTPNQASKAPPGAGLVMARDSGLIPEGETITTKFTQKLHTVHMLYRSPDSLWSAKDKLEAVVLVVAPDTKMGEVVNFVSQMEMRFPSQKQFARSTLDAAEVTRLKKSVEGPFSALKVKMPTATRTGSLSGSMTSTIDNTNVENKLGELGVDEASLRKNILDKLVPKKILDKIVKIEDKICPCLPGPRRRKAAKGLEDGDHDADDEAMDAPDNQEMNE